MDNSITPDELAQSLVDYCRGYTDDICTKVGDGIAEIGKEAVDEVKELAPVYAGKNKNTPKGAYRRNWTYVIEKSRGVITVTVHVKGKHYRLTHLLENGHLNRDGTSRSKAIPHISTAAKSAERKADKLIEEATNGT